jgi:vacuolar-type H+-ATPase subunit H
MALHMLRSSPSFTVTLRGYDKDEVDEYIESVRESQEHEIDGRADAESRVQFLESELRRMSNRVSELETSVLSETPRSIEGLGQRLALILEHAEVGATETIEKASEEANEALVRARQDADRIMHAAEQRMADCESQAAIVIRSAEESAEKTQAQAQQSADLIVRDAEAHATARIADVEQWAAEVRAQILEDQARAREEFARVKVVREQEIADLIARRRDVVDSLRQVCHSLEESISDAGEPVRPELSVVEEETD